MGAVPYAARPRRVSNLIVAGGPGVNNVDLSWDNPTHRTDGTPITLDALDSVVVYRDTARLASLSGSPGQAMNYTDVLTSGGSYTYEIVAFEGANAGMNAWTARSYYGDVPDVIIYSLDPSPTSEEKFLAAVPSGYTASTATAVLGNEPPTGVQVAIVLLGIFPNNHVLSEVEAAPLVAFANSGGSLYMEGADTWAFDPLTSLHSMFGILGVSDGMGDLGIVDGVPGTYTWWMQLYYIGENSYIDQLAPNDPAAFTVANNQSPAYACAVAADFGTRRAVGASWELGGFSSTPPFAPPEDLAEGTLQFLLGITDAPPVDPALPTMLALAAAPNPFNPATTFSFDLPRASHVRLEVHNVLGQRVATLVDGPMNAGTHDVHWDAAGAASGVYLARIASDAGVATTKVTLLR